jgi:hypothetical protein
LSKLEKEKAALLYMKLSGIPGPLAARIKRMASFANPVFFKTQALRFSTRGIPR